MTLTEMIQKAQRASRFPLLSQLTSTCTCDECSKRRSFVLLLEKGTARPH